MNTYLVQIAIDIPLFKLFEYSWNQQQLGRAPEVGVIVEIEFGKKKIAGIVLEINPQSDRQLENPSYKIKEVIKISPCPIMRDEELKLFQFLSKYYLRPIGEVVFASIPSEWKKPNNWEKIQKSIHKKETKNKISEYSPLNLILTHEQNFAISELKKLSIDKKYSITFLRGVTGSGKTAVYLEWVKNLTDDPSKQCLILVPEINLTPQLEKTVRSICLQKEVIILHSNLTPSERNYAWWKIQMGRGQIIVGTRLSVFTAIKHLSAIIIDEEHDNSYKQQDGMRYSARDVAIWRAADLKIPVLLCSATPSLETWEKVLNKKIALLTLSKRAKFGATTPIIEIIDTNKEKNQEKLKLLGLCEYTVDQIHKTSLRKKQSLIFINRRGYAPVLTCHACKWKSQCKNCSSWQVFHKTSGINKRPMMQCHHCGIIEKIPDECPECGNQDLRHLGVGTQSIEESIEKELNELRVLRIDTDTTRLKGSAQKLFEKIHQGEVDVVIGTQMLSKGHDFSNVETVVVVDIDKSLYSYDFRATEKMYAQLIQVAGRSGRGENLENSKIIIQTAFPEHKIFKAIKEESFNEYYEELLDERKIAKLPPFTYQALIIAESKDQTKNVIFLKELKGNVERYINNNKDCIIYDPVPRSIQRVGGIERTQILIESFDRKKLQIYLEKTLDYSEEMKTRNRSIKVIIERDPISF
jgi:primosomal protein N' (replication factor Y)